MYIPSELFVNPENERAVFEIVDQVYSDISCKAAGYDPKEAAMIVITALRQLGEVKIADAIMYGTLLWEI